MRDREERLQDILDAISHNAYSYLIRKGLCQERRPAPHMGR